MLRYIILNQGLQTSSDSIIIISCILLHIYISSVVMWGQKNIDDELRWNDPIRNLEGGLLSEVSG